MSPSVTSFALIEFIIGSTAAVLAYVTWKYRERPAGTPLFAMAITGIVYTGTSVFASTRRDPLSWELATNLLYPLTAAIAVESFYVAVEFTQRREYQHPVVRTLLGGFVLASLATALTNPVHNLLNTSPKLTAEGVFVVTNEPLFWIHTIIALMIILFSITLLAIELVDTDGIYREQITVIIGGFLIGIVFFLWEAIAPVHSAFNLATVGIVGWCFVTLWGVARVDLLETAPIARKTLIDSMEDAVFALDTERRVVDVNSSAREQFDIESDVVGYPVTDVLAEYPPLLETINAQQNEREITLKQHGDEQHYHVRTSPVYDTRLRLEQLHKRELQIGQTVVIRNITERKQREKEIERQNKRLDEFVSVVSHDLRNPLSVAVGRVELARDECDSDHLDAAVRAHERMGMLIDDLLALARSGQSIDEMEPLDLTQITEYCWQNVDTAEATLVTDVDQNIFAGRSRLYQLVENLIRNAVEHGGEDVTITLGTLEDGFYVADSGPGIAPEERDRVFESGYSTAESGNGFGLRIVKQIAEGHGWDITVTDSESGGARFEFTGVTTTNEFA